MLVIVIRPLWYTSKRFTKLLHKKTLNSEAPWAVEEMTLITSFKFHQSYTELKYCDPLPF